MPVCPYIGTLLRKHREFADITDPVTPDVLLWLDAELRAERATTVAHPRSGERLA